jgi:UDP-4-amino-4,6-dideoxy-N-acetyl-beta-L-altrosamine N-acetyltransferase
MLTMRTMEVSDRERLLEWRNLPHVARYMYTGHLIAPEEHSAWFGRALADANRLYWIIQFQEVPVGLANIYDISRQNLRCSWAYYIADETMRGRGIGSMVEFFIIEYAFGFLGLEKLWCEVLADNEAVVKLHERHGFVREALFRDHIQKAGQFIDVVGLGLLKKDWQLLRPMMVQRFADLGLPLPERGV